MSVLIRGKQVEDPGLTEEMVSSLENGKMLDTSFKLKLGDYFPVKDFFVFCYHAEPGIRAIRKMNNMEVKYSVGGNPHH